uniref:Uncharacterized protein n=1 Tax=Spongospora subterranea TaxID=70186 RepID=A0A0H5R5X7_9EUKA|eukprot:CRZ09261.1 hypothetical protein [Spongospora subterranea]
MPLDSSQIKVQIDSLVNNPVVSAGPEQNEVKEVTLSKLEQFFVDVHNVFVEESMNNDNAAKRDDPASDANPIIQAEQFINMAKFQMDNLGVLIDKVINRAGFTITQAAPAPAVEGDGSRNLLVIRAKRSHLREAASILRRGATRIKAGATVTDNFTADLRKLSKFWLITRLPNKSLAIDISVSSTRPKLIPLIQLSDGHISLADIPDCPSIFDELRNRFESGIYRFAYDFISSNIANNLTRCQRHPDRIVWQGLHCRIEVLSNFDVNGTSLSGEISAAALSQLIYFYRNLDHQSKVIFSQPLSLAFSKTLKFVDHGYLCQEISSTLFSLFKRHRRVLDLTQLHCDSYLKTVWRIHSRKSLLAEVIVDDTNIVVCIVSAPERAYQVQCYSASLVKLVVEQALI